ncbi:MAG: helix-hairpin-helix domain-containing protein [Polyangiales bacterium]
MIRRALPTLLALVALTGAAWADPPRAAATATATATAPASAGPGVVNINEAGADELVRLPGVGPARADAIVRLRERVRRFHRAEDLLRVRGIGRVGFRRMRPFVSLAGPTTLMARPPRAQPSR